jgi:hypothetical protein
MAALAGLRRERVAMDIVRDPYVYQRATRHANSVPERSPREISKVE